jgi:hypothetical protein
MTNKLYFLPQETNYSFKMPETVLRTEMYGGFSKFRNDLLNAYVSLTCEWHFTYIQYTEFINFYRIGTNNGKSEFITNLFLESAEIVEHNCYFQNPSLSEINEAYVIIKDTLFVKPLMITEANDLAIIEAFEANHV